METTIELSRQEVEKIIADHIRTIACSFATDKDIDVSGNSYSGLTAKVTISDRVEPVDSESKVA